MTDALTALVAGGRASWLGQLYATHAVAHAIGVLALVCVAGLAFGSLKIRGIGLGTAGVLFAGIVVGHFGKPVEHAMLDFVKEFGLILFVFTIGLQLGPGFFAAWRQQGVKLNLFTLGIIALGTGLAPFGGWLLGFDPAATLGLLAGAVTNTPALGAVQQTLGTLPDVAAERVALPAVAYAVAYPAAIAGIIGSMLALRSMFGIDAVAEGEAFVAEQRATVEPLLRRTLVVANPNLVGVALADVPGRVETGVTVSRVRCGAEATVRPALGSTVLALDDRLLAVGTRAMLDQFQLVVGRAGEEDLMEAAGDVVFRRVVVTARDVLGCSLPELGLERLGVVVTRVARGDVELTPAAGLRLKFGDVLQVVGAEDDVAKAAARLGNALRELNATQFVPFFLGIFAGIALGTLPIPVPGLPEPVRLGLAGGPLLVALLLGWAGNLGRLVWHMPANANLAVRELGIALFLAAVGLAAGPRFFASVFSATGVQWLAVALVVTVVPLVAAGVFARVVLGLNFAVLSGVLAGSVTDPPALAFATGLARSDAPTIGYATVYPLAMLMRILAAQVLTLALCG